MAANTCQLHLILTVAFVISINLAFIGANEKGAKSDTVRTFFGDFVKEKRVVVLDGYLKKLTKRWPDEVQLGKLPESFTTYLKLEDDDEVSLRKFLVSYRERKLKAEVDLPQSYRDRMDLPGILSSVKTTGNTLSAVITGSNDEHDADLVKDTMLCQWKGNVDLLLKKLADDLDDLNEKTEDRTGQDLFEAKLEEGSCILIPADRHMVLKTLDVSWTLLFSWSHLEDNRVDGKCNEWQSTKTFGDIAAVDQIDFDFKFLEYLIATFGFKEKNAKEALKNDIMKDGIMSNVQDWNEAKKLKVDQLLDILDTNKDGKFDAEDLTSINRSKLKEISASTLEKYDEINKGGTEETQEQESDSNADKIEPEVEVEDVKGDAKEAASGFNMDDLNLDFNKLLSDSIGSAFKEVLESEDFMKEVAAEIGKLKDKGINIGDISKVMDAMKTSTASVANNAGGDGGVESDEGGAGDEGVESAEGGASDEGGEQREEQTTEAQDEQNDRSNREEL